MVRGGGRLLTIPLKRGGGLLEGGGYLRGGINRRFMVNLPIKKTL